MISCLALSSLRILYDGIQIIIVLHNKKKKKTSNDCKNNLTLKIYVGMILFMNWSTRMNLNFK